MSPAFSTCWRRRSTVKGGGSDFRSACAMIRACSYGVVIGTPIFDFVRQFFDQVRVRGKGPPQAATVPDVLPLRVVQLFQDRVRKLAEPCADTALMTSKAVAMGGNDSRGSIARPWHWLSTLRRAACSRPTQDSLLAGCAALACGIGYPQVSCQGSARCYPDASSFCPNLCSAQ